MGDAPQLTYSQEERLLTIETTLGETELLLERFSGTESISTPFEFRVTLLSPNFSVDLTSLLRTAATVTVFLPDGTPRYFNAVFRSITQAKEGAEIIGERSAMAVTNPATDLAVYDAVLVPQVWFLSLDANCKIFQNLSVVDIVTNVLQACNVPNFSFRTTGTYPVREYCVQYRESSLNFISRLLEEEGIFYFFEHTQDKHTIVFADASSTLPACPNQATAQYSYSEEGWVGEGQHGIKSLERVQAAYTGQVAFTDYNFETPSNKLLSNLGSTFEEAFDYPGEYLTTSDGDRYSRIRLEEKEALQFVVNGTSGCRSFQPGVYFELDGHYRSDTNQNYFLTGITHMAYDMTYRQEALQRAGKAQAPPAKTSKKGKDGEEEGEEEGQGAPEPPAKPHDYNNSFTAIPQSVSYRPPRKTMRPTVHGLQSALVVGKAGEEIWVDNYGRVKVQFYWDRYGSDDENSSCWIRVSQIWAGKNWGWITIPRIGQEVLVDFLEGDPDRPIIVGRVYNADQMPPYTLNANQTQSGIKTRSSKGGGTSNFNEIRFEDLMGSEMLTVHAEKDMDTSVEHDDTQLVQNNRTINVNGTHTETIVKDTSITITQGNHTHDVQQGNQTIQVDQGNQTITISKGNQTTTITMGNQTTTVSAGSASHTAMQSITLTVGPSSISITPEGITLEAPMITLSGDMMITIESDGLLDMSGDLTMINCG